MEPLSMLITDCSQDFWEEIKMRMKKVHFQWHSAAHLLIRFQHVLNQVGVIVCTVIYQKVVHNLNKTLPCFQREATELDGKHRIRNQWANEYAGLQLGITQNVSKFLLQIQRSFPFSIHCFHEILHQVQLNVQWWQIDSMDPQEQDAIHCICQQYCTFLLASSSLWSDFHHHGYSKNKESTCVLYSPVVDEVAMKLLSSHHIYSSYNFCSLIEMFPSFQQHVQVEPRASGYHRVTELLSSWSCRSLWTVSTHRLQVCSRVHSSNHQRQYRNICHSPCDRMQQVNCDDLGNGKSLFLFAEGNTPAVWIPRFQLFSFDRDRSLTKSFSSSWVIKCGSLSSDSTAYNSSPASSTWLSSLSSSLCC